MLFYCSPVLNYLVFNVTLFLERAPFVFTDEMAFVMGGKGGTLFKNFEDYCT
jgi:hypothetical protein